MRVAVIFGGSSFEHEISIVSAITIKKVLQDTPNLSLSFIYLGVDNRGNRDFYLINEEEMKANFFSAKSFLKSPKLVLKQGGFFQNTLLGAKQISVGAILNLIHGRDGEDGKIAALLDFYGVAFIGPRLEASVVSYDKELTKSFANSRGVKTLPYCVLYKEHLEDFEEVRRRIQQEQIQYPLIVKPARLGSSLGVSIVESDKELSYGLDVAFEFDSKVIVEPFIKGVGEYNLAGFYSDKWEFSIIEEPQKEEFLDFEKKYLDFSRSSEITEADISRLLRDEMRENFIKIYSHLFNGAIIRCDFFVIDGECYLNEINPVPGSLANYLFSDFKTSFLQLLSHLPKEKMIPISFDLLHSIQGAKGGK